MSSPEIAVSAALVGARDTPPLNLPVPTGSGGGHKSLAILGFSAPRGSRGARLRV
jgi:hypothetical protein